MALTALAKSEATMKAFTPELIVEATTVCDRACNGCYAPNVVSKEDATLLLKNSPSLFLTQEKLASTLSLLPEIPRNISVRGG